MSMLISGDAQASDQIFACRRLTKRYCTRGVALEAVSEVAFGIQSGDFVTITGRSGSGKSTLLSLIAGLTRPTRGELELFGQNLAAAGDRQISDLRGSQVGYVFQFNSLIPTLNAIDNVRLPGLLTGRTIDALWAGSLLDLLGIGEKGESFPCQLSGGQQARVALARALANHPGLLLADEPTGNLDVETEREILSLLQMLNQRQGLTIVLVTHSAELAAYGTRHLVMDRGSLCEMQLMPAEENADG